MLGRSSSDGVFVQRPAVFNLCIVFLCVSCTPDTGARVEPQNELKQTSISWRIPPPREQWEALFTGYDLKALRGSLALTEIPELQKSYLHVSQEHQLGVSTRSIGKWEKTRDQPISGAYGCNLSGHKQVYNRLVQAQISNKATEILLDIPFRASSGRRRRTFSPEDINDLRLFFESQDCEGQRPDHRIRHRLSGPATAINLGKLLASVDYDTAQAERFTYVDVPKRVVGKWFERSPTFRASYIQAIARAHLIRRTLLESIAESAPEDRDEAKETARTTMSIIMWDVACTSDSYRENPERILLDVQQAYPKMLRYAAKWHIADRESKADDPSHYLNRFRGWQWDDDEWDYTKWASK